MDKKNLISIIIPVYNGEWYIEKCVRSIEEQTYRKYEIILVNDGSSDRTEEVCLKLKEKNSCIHYYYQNNAGAGAARNLGLRHVSGEYVMFVDSDDCIHPAYIEELYSLMHRVDAEIACCSCYKGNGEEIEKFLKQKRKVVYDKRFSAKEAIASLFYRREIMGYPVCKLFRKEVIETIFFRTNMRLGEDFQYIFDVLCKAKRIAYLDKQLYFYFQNYEGITHTLKYEDMKKAWCMIKEKMDVEIVKDSKELKNAVASKLFILGLDYLIKMVDMEPDEIFEEELQKYISENCVKIFMDHKCKISNRILAGLCKIISIKGTVKICYLIKELNQKMGIQMKKAV